MALLAEFRNFQIPCQYFSADEDKDDRLLTSRLNLLRNNLRMGVRRIDHTGKRPFPHQLRHTVAVQPSLKEHS